jgi:hypothetical protein
MVSEIYRLGMVNTEYLAWVSMDLGMVSTDYLRWVGTDDLCYGEYGVPRNGRSRVPLHYELGLPAK